jgi:glycosyltransferase involved in cell wall biosynthesis
MEDLVSVIIPTYNRYELLCNSIRSVIEQSYPNIEIIVVNDCSTDQRYYNGTLEKFAKTTVIHLEVNQKVKYNTPAAQGMVRQVGVDNSTGEWIAFLDDDDFFLQDKLKIQINEMKRQKYLFSSTNMYIVNHNRLSENKLDFTVIRPYFRKNILPTVFTPQLIEKNNYICNSSVVMHRSIVEQTGPFKPVKYEDWDYWKRALQYTTCLYIDIPLCYYTMQVLGNQNVKNYVISSD